MAPKEHNKSIPSCEYNYHDDDHEDLCIFECTLDSLLEPDIKLTPKAQEYRDQLIIGVIRMAKKVASFNNDGPDMHQKLKSNTIQTKEVCKMDLKEFAKLLNGVEYPFNVQKETQKIAKLNGFVIVYGASDDLMEFDGVVYDEISAYNGGIAFFDENGLIVNECEDCDCPYLERVMKTAQKIEAFWCKEEGISWSYETAIPHETFDIIEDDRIYCRGLVFELKNVARAP